MTPRLFKNTNKLAFIGAVHEHILISGKIFSIDATLIHYGYSEEDNELMEKKFQRNISLLLSELEENPDNIKYRIYTSIQYFVHHNFKKALEHAQIAYDIIKQKNLNPKEHLFLYSILASCFLNNNKFEEAKEICLEGLCLSDEHIDLYYYLANLEMRDKKYDSAIEHYKKYLYLIAHFEELSIRANFAGQFGTMNRFEEVYADISLMYIESEQYDLALEYIQKVTSDEFYERVFGIVIKALVLSKQFSKLKEYYDNVVLLRSENEIDTFLAMMETALQKLTDDEWLYLQKEFSEGQSPYSRFCAIRCAYIEKNPSLANMIKDFISEFDIKSNIYADIIYYNKELEEKQKIINEFEQCKLQLKNIIRNLISSNQFGQAKDVIMEYKKIVKDDEEIERLESEILG